MNEFNLYCLTNFDAEQLINPLKRTTLLLGFIKGPNVKDWVKDWTMWTVNKYTTGQPSVDEHYWNMIMNAFQYTFQDTGARERAEDQLRKLAFAPNAVDIFITQFKSLAHEATYHLDDKPTISLFTSKLPYKMVDHIYKVVRPGTFAQWAEAVQPYHTDNTAVNNLRGLYEDTPKKNFQQKKGFSPQQLARILGVKLPSDPDAMDTRADRTCSFNRNKGSKGRVTTTTPAKDTDKQRKEGCCFHCNKQGHISRNCLKKKKEDTKARKAETEDSGQESEAESAYESAGEEFGHAVIRLGRSMSEEGKMKFILNAIEADKAGDDGDKSKSSF